MAQGHGKASAGAAAALRNALKEHGKLIDDKLENQAHAALAAAGETGRLAALARRPVAPGAGGQGRGPVRNRAPARRTAPRTSRRRGEASRPQPHQPAAAQAALWRPQDAGAAARAARAVEADRPGRRRPTMPCGSVSTKPATRPTRWSRPGWTRSRPRRPSTAPQRLALIEEVKAWAAANTTALDGDWKGFNRVLHQFESRWREAGHLSEKAFAELQPQWKEAIQAAEAPLAAVQKQSLERRHAMIDEAKVLGAAPQLRIDAVKALQQRWQAEAQAVPLDRKHEQKLWDAFRKPIDEAFQRKTERARERGGGAERARPRGAGCVQGAGGSQRRRRRARRSAAAMAALDAALQGPGRGAGRQGPRGCASCRRGRTCGRRRNGDAAAAAAARPRAPAKPRRLRPAATPAGAQADTQARRRHARRRPPRHEEGRARAHGPRRPARATARSGAGCRSGPLRRPPLARRPSAALRRSRRRGPRPAPGRRRLPRAARGARACAADLAQAGRAGAWRGADAAADGLGAARRRPGAQPAANWARAVTPGSPRQLGQGPARRAGGRCLRGPAAAGDRRGSADAGRPDQCAPRSCSCSC